MSPRLRILYAEDNAFDADLTRSYFAEHAPDLELEIVGTGEQCLERLAQAAPDLLLLDHHLPDMEGLDVLRTLARSRALVPVVVVTGVGDEDLVVQALRLGASYYVPKLGDYLRGLPSLLRGVVAEHHEKDRQGHFATQPWRILYVEHVSSDIELTRQHFGEVAPLVELQVASTCAEALDLLARAPAYDALLIDLRMPDQSGLDFVREAKRRNLPLPPFVMLSGKGDEAAAIATLRLGASDYITKRNGYLDRLVYTVDRVIAHERLDRLNAQLEQELQARERIEADLRTQRVLLASQSEASVDGILSVDAGGRVIWYNRRFQEMWGVPTELMQERSDAALLRFAQSRLQDPDSFLTTVRRLYAERAARGRHELHLVDGRTFDRHSAPVTDENGTYLGRVWLFRDMSQERKLQASVAQADRLASMGMLAASVAHEINNPLSYVLHGLESLSDDLPKLCQGLCGGRADAGPRGEDGASASSIDATHALRALCDEALERVREALAGTRRIRAITRGLGAFSRVEQSAPEPVDVQVGIEHAIAMAFNELRHRARLVTDFSPVPPVLASEGKLAQVFLNLLINAAHAIEEGKVDENEVRVRTWAEGAWVCAAVSDTGRGILPAHQRQVFEPFFTTKGVGTGTGLGLSICRDLVTGFGGEISFESTPGKGTRFLVKLPGSPDRRVPTAHDSAEPSPGLPTARGRLLVIDDDDGVRCTIVRILQRDHEVVSASSGEEGRRLLETDQDFEVIFCDLMMPGTSGMDLHRWLLEQAPRVAERVVFVTGGAFTPGASSYLAQVDNPRIEKPFSSASLRRLANERVLWAREITGPKE